MPEAVIAAAVRTPIGRAHKGSLADVRPDDLAAFAVRTLVEQVPELDSAEIVDVIVGCGFPEAKQGMNLARRVALLAGLPPSVPGTTVNRFCASSLQTIRMAFHAIRAAEGDVFVAAGVESISQVSGYPKDADELHPALSGGEGSITNVYVSMGITAENVAERYGVARDEMDRFAQRSQERAVAAQADGFFARELTPYPKEDGTVVAQDDGPRPSSTLEKLAALEPAFLPDGLVTAGNACPLNDGAAAVLVLSDERARELGIAPRARIIASSVSGIDPEFMGVGPIEAVRARARPRGDDDRGRRRDGAQRGVRGAGDPGLPRGRRRPLRRAAEPARRRDRARPPLRDDRRTDHVHAPERPRRGRRDDRPRDDVRRRRAGDGDARRAAALDHY